MESKSQFVGFVHLGRVCLVVLLSLFGALGHEVLAADDHYEHPITCSAFLPRDAVPAASPHLCTANLNGKTQQYACQDARTGAGLYRLYFKGGRHPMAIARINARNEVSEFVWREKHAASQPDCNLPAPPQLRVGTKFRGIGICEDDNARSVPCAVFRERVPRIKLFHVYLTFYDLKGRGPTYTRYIYTGVNDDAMPAELEYQIGLSLLKTRCCQPTGLKYIEHAFKLFPDSELYRATYQHYKAEFQEKENHQFSFN